MIEFLPISKKQSELLSLKEILPDMAIQSEIFSNCQTKEHKIKPIPVRSSERAVNQNKNEVKITNYFLSSVGLNKK